MRICSGPGCLRSVADSVRFCDECKPTAAPITDEGIKQHTTGYDELLDGLNKGKRWQSIRDIAIRRCPLCARCNERVSEIVDHIVPAHEAIAQAQMSGRYGIDKYAGYYLLSNLQGLCRPCHYAKTLEDKAHVGEWPDVVTRELQAPKRRWAF